MVALVAFASLPFGLKGGSYRVKTPLETVSVYVSELRYNPFLTVTSRPELAQAIPPHGEGDGFVTYTWYDHPFVLRVAFGRNMASLGSINSCATVLHPLPEGFDLENAAALHPLCEHFSERSLLALNVLIGVVRRRAKLFHVFDLRRDDIEVTVRGDDGSLLQDDPLQATLSQDEQQSAESFDLLHQDDTWYALLSAALESGEPTSLADDLLMEAERALTRRFPRQAIATCHIAVEIAASELLTRGMLRRGVPAKEVDHVLSTKSLTSKLDALLATYTGFSLRRSNATLWKAFNQLNELRNQAVHHGKPTAPADAEFAIGVARNIASWLELVRLRNK